jgi:hypothetical protein
MRTPRTKIVIGVLILVLVAFLAWVSFQSRPARRAIPNVSIRLLGYTNDSSGTQLAIIAVTNLNAYKIFVYRPTIQIKAPTEPGGVSNYFQGGTNQWRQFNSLLSGGMSGTFTIPRPTNQSPWRLSFFVYNDFGTVQVVIRRVTGRRYLPFEIYGDWIDNEK